MIEEFEYQGYWWLPDNSEKRVPGILKFDPDEGANLDLLGSLRGLEGVADTCDPEIILGLSSDGKDITLKSCQRATCTVSFGGFATSFTADTVFVGEQYSSRSRRQGQVH